MSEVNGRAGSVATDAAARIGGADSANERGSHGAVATHVIVPGVVDTLEPDRHELREAPRYRFSLSRRQFLGTVGAGVVVLVVVRDGLSLDEQEFGEAEALRASADPIGAWLHIGEDGAVTVFTGKVEVGQDIRTSLTQAVAEELDVPPSSITLIMGDTDRVPYDAGTFGSRSTPQMGTQLRRAAAAARATLLRLAADRWEVDDVAQLELAAGRVIHRASGRSAGIGELTGGRKLVETIAADQPLEPATRWTVAGTPLRKVKGPDIVTGRHRYASDMRLPGMLVGKVLRPPSFGARLASLDTSAAEAIPGVVVVRDGEFVGVAAPDEATANRALAALRAEWETTASHPSHRNVFEHLRRTASGSGNGRGGPGARGDIEAGLAAADERLEASYTAAYIAHVPLEPRAALAQWEGDKLTVWTGTQRPFGVRAELARAFRIGEERVRVIVPDTGSAYGGKHTGETAIEAARLAKAAGRPVRLVWTREEEFTWAYFRPAGIVDIRSGVRRDGTLTAWDFHNYNSGAAAIRTPYEVANARTVFHPADSPLRQGSYRALAATFNNFARETHMDELAARVGMDPLAFRLQNLRDARLRAVLEAAAERFGWGRWQPSPGRGIGLACGVEKGGYVATCAEVAVERSSGQVRVLRIVQAFECGAIVNPDGLRNQVEGALIMGLGGALWEAIEFEDGRILNPRLSQYRVPRFTDVPPIDVVLLDRKDLPSAGAGETPIIAVAPAIGNAIFHAAGVRLRSLPLVPYGLRAPGNP
ncbi:MAG TPA: molybdopterin cofactor-binding domain-containing protein [Longimicrobiales bacterium]